MNKEKEDMDRGKKERKGREESKRGKVERKGRNEERNKGSPLVLNFALWC